jgi:AcrR family transcriptional regulator
MLDAAEDVVLRDGIGRLTLDAVAKEARLSKGGLMHHFPTKDALIDAMVRRKVQGWREECDEAIERQPPGPGRVARAMLELCLGDDADCGDTDCRRCFVLVAALVHDAKHVQPLREVQRDMVARFESDGLPAGLGDAVHLAMGGLWFDRMFGLTEFTGKRLGNVRRALEGAVEMGAGARADDKGRVVRSKRGGGGGGGGGGRAGGRAKVSRGGPAKVRASKSGGAKR